MVQGLSQVYMAQAKCTQVLILASELNGKVLLIDNSSSMEILAVCLELQ